MTKILTSILILLLVFSSRSAIAGPDEEMRDAALSEAAKLRSEGWPKDRCFAGIRVFNSIVAEGNGEILAGDKILYVNSTSLENSPNDSFIKALDSIPPTSVVNFQVQRNGAVINLQQQCSNLADIQRPYLQALDFAGKKKWYECIDALGGRPDDLEYLDLRARCARVSRKVSEYPVQQWFDQAMTNSIAIASFTKESWNTIPTALLKARIELSPSVYDMLVDKVKAWDGGTLWHNAQPDFSTLRRAAERGVKSRLIDPQSAIIEMPFDFIYGSWTPAFTTTRFEGFMTCGTVNAKNRMGGYTGSTSFISVVDETGFEKYTDMDSATSQYIRPVDNGCAQLIKKLKYVGIAASTEATVGGSQIAAPSISQELAKLADLHAKGALTDEEYAAAKARILSGK